MCGWLFTEWKKSRKYNKREVWVIESPMLQKSQKKQHRISAVADKNPWRQYIAEMIIAWPLANFWHEHTPKN